MGRRQGARAHQGLPERESIGAGTNTYPVYNRDGRTLEAWRMRSQIQLESRRGAMSALIGKLQGLACGLADQPPTRSRDRCAAENQATVEALADFADAHNSWQTRSVASTVSHA